MAMNLAAMIMAARKLHTMKAELQFRTILAEQCAFPRDEPTRRVLTSVQVVGALFIIPGVAGALIGLEELPSFSAKSGIVLCYMMGCFGLTNLIFLQTKSSGAEING